MVLSSAEAKAEDRAAKESRSLPPWDCASTQHAAEVNDYQNYRPEIPAFPHLSSEKTKKRRAFFFFSICIFIALSENRTAVHLIMF